MRPIIGISAYVESARWGPWDTPAVLVPAAYVRAVEAAGGRALLVPPSSGGVEETLDALDGLVFSGGADIEPGRYRAASHEAVSTVRPDRDEGELALLTAALDRDLPVLCICRGMQLLNVALGGTLDQHLPDHTEQNAHLESPGVFAEHAVAIKDGSRLCSILGDRQDVKSHHHQAPDIVGEGLQDVARAEDGTIEGIEHPAKQFTLGILWHPEESEDRALFEALVEEAAKRKAVG